MARNGYCYMNKPVPEFTKTEITTTGTTLVERCVQPVEIPLADTGIRPESCLQELTTCPAVDWMEGNCHFLLIKTGQHTCCHSL